MKNTTKQPHEYSRRILVAVSGMSPQIITETLYGLAIKQTPAFIPTEIHVITTLAGEKEVILQLLHPKTGKFQALCQDYGLDSINFSADNIHIILDGQDSPLEDIKTPQQNEDAADFITTLIGELTNDDSAALHVSIAGGRKTMGYYAGYALSLYGRKQDELSHVLVTDKYEGLRDFFYPTPNSHVIQDRDKNSLDTKEAKVMMAKIPFVRLRRGLPEELLNGKLLFSESIEFAQQDDKPPLLQIKPFPFLSVHDVDIKLTEINYVAYLWFLEKYLTGKPVKRGDEIENAQDFILFYEKILNIPLSETTLKPFRKRGSKFVNNSIKNPLAMPEDFLSDRITAIKKAFEKKLGDYQAKYYIVKNQGYYGESFYIIPLSEDQVQYIKN
ncbi:MAG: TIGR02584 family CRISPR-associated protein [Methylococcales bacterium]|nr:TIGR02584 family CRISPR-associated protein [Methylococcales bacterium]